MQEMPNWLKNRAFLTPNRIALKTEDLSMTFKELHEKAFLLAKKLSCAGVKKQDHVAVLMNNSVEMVFFIHALKYIGAVTVLINTRLSKHELSYQLSDSNSVFLLTENTFLPLIQNLSTKVLLREEVPLLEDGVFSLQENFSLNETDTIMYTSGTTGAPKGVLQTYGNHWWSAIGSALNMGLYEEDCWLAAVPFFHISGLSILNRSVIYGMPVFVHYGFNPIKANEAIKYHGVTIMSVVSAMLTKMIQELDKDKYPSTFRCMLLGGGPAPLPLLEECLERSIPVYQTYGMTETASQIVTLSPEYSMKKIGSAGKPLFPAQLKIEKDGELLSPYEEGEIVVKGPNVMKGYYQRNVETEKEFKDGWFYTGDIGFVDEEGFLFVLDRRSDLIVSGGENVYPAEIESILLSHPKVKDAGVTGLQDATWGQVPAAFIVSGQDLSEDEIIDFCKEKLAKYKVPRSIYFVSELPRNASNKLLRRKLIDLL
ncbi:o-succinylbenzoate--CoA ligase [Bacillus timonensis]|nr:o-succinylbenzoate--CoA ligase [Bacillus timonensis]